jgi:competence protein ComEC
VPAGIYALEVGQGDAHLIVSGRRGILIDAGPVPSRVLPTLRQYVDHLEALVLTHNDRDHCGAAIKILQEYGATGRISAFWSLQDRASDERANQSIQYALELKERGALKMFRLERGSRPIQVGRLPGGFLLELLHPNYSTALTATGIGTRRGCGPNSASAVLRLVSNGRGIGLWSGDLPAGSWERLLVAKADVSALWFSVPHHGSGADWSVAQIERVLSAVHPQWTILSVGTGNQYDHPAPSWISLGMKYGATVLCTQLTRKCHSPPEQLKPGVLPAYDNPSKREALGVSCGGSVALRVPDPGGSIAQPKVLRMDEHQRAVDSKVRHALCRQR